MITMGEYIERDNAVRVALDACVKVIGHGISLIKAVDVADAIDAIPAADVVEVRHGEWTKEGCGILVCSNCGFEYDHAGVPEEGVNYCPNCGAKMDGKGDCDG